MVVGLPAKPIHNVPLCRGNAYAGCPIARAIFAVRTIGAKREALELIFAGVLGSIGINRRPNLTVSGF